MRYLLPKMQTENTHNDKRDNLITPLFSSKMKIFTEERIMKKGRK